ncbi:MAG: DUF445 family protein, partial [Bacillota bacterium]|nr:DUF445 family protein [Bacillota bacterium]
GSLEKALNYAMTLLDDIASRFERNHEWQKKADEQLKQLLYRIIDRVHENIELMVRENLNRYTDSMLVDLIESKAGNDLQLIRINGSVVGGLVGILIFVITKGF